MKKRLYISNDEAGFFDNNKMLCLDNPPTQGDFIVGDIVISNRQENGVFGWVCVLAGSPGRWEVICDIVEVKNGILKNVTDIQALITRIAAAEINIVNIEEVVEELDGRVTTNENNINSINSQVDLAKKTIVTLTGQIANNTNQIQKVEGNLDDLSELVGANADAAGEAATGLMKEINDLKEIVGSNAEAGEEVASGMQKEIQDIKTFVGLGDEEEGGSNLQDRLDSLEEFVGIGAEGDQKGLTQQLEELRDLIGANTEGDEEARGGIIKDINDIKQMIGYVDGNTYTVPLLEKINELQNLVGTPAKDDESATGLHKDIEDLHEVVDEVKEQYLKFWVGTNAEYQALTSVEHGRLYIIID